MKLESLPNTFQALVLVYQNLSEFYKVAFEILTRKGVKWMMKIIKENDRLSEIVEDFLKHAQTLAKIVTKATLEIGADIQAMLRNHWEFMLNRYK